MAGWITDAWFKLTTGKTASQIEAETAANNEILAKRDADLVARGVWDAKAQEARRENAQAEWEYWNNTSDQLAAAAAEGAREGLDAMQASVKDTITSATTFSLRAVLGFIPWWLWLAAAGYLAFRLGLLDGAMRQLRGKLK